MYHGILKERTMMIRKEVIIMRIDGNNDNTVKIKNNFILELISSGSSVELIVIPLSEMDIPGQHTQLCITTQNKAVTI